MWKRLLLLFGIFLFYIMLSTNSVKGAGETLTANPTKLYENRLDYASIKLVISGTDFKQGSALTASNYRLNNAPPGLTIRDITTIDKNINSEYIILAYDGTDFTGDITNFSVTVLSGGTQNGAVVTSNNITIKDTGTTSTTKTLTADSIQLSENALNGNDILLSLTGDDFNSGVVSNVTLNNAPSGVSIASVTKVSNRLARVTLNYTGIDFDTDIPNFNLTVQGAGLDSGAPLTTNNIQVKAIKEVINTTLSATSNPSPLIESNLNGANIILALDNQQFLEGATKDDFILNNPPGGLSITGYSRDSSNINRATLTLAFDGTDFDTDISNFSITAKGTALSEGLNLVSNTMNITAIVEGSGSLIASPNPSPLTEANLNGATITLNLTNEEFANTATKSDFALNNAPPGLTIASYTRSDPDRRTATLNLSFNGTDFDASYMNFSISVKGTAVTGGADLTSNTMFITAIIEGPTLLSATTNPNPLKENTLNGSVIDITLTDGVFADSLGNGDIQLNNAPTGLNVGTVIRDSDTKARLVLSYDYGVYDFDTTIPDFSVTVLDSGLKAGTSVTSNTFFIYAVLEIDGQMSYISSGESYPIRIQMAGVDTRQNKLYLNFDLYTNQAVGTRTPHFDYFIEVFDSNQNIIGFLKDNMGNNMDYFNPKSVVGTSGQNTIVNLHEMVQLNQDFPAGYRIVITVKDVKLL